MLQFEQLAFQCLLDAVAVLHTSEGGNVSALNAVLGLYREVPKVWTH